MTELPGRKVVVATDSFKGSLTSAEVAEAAARGARAAGFDVWARGIADGGEGTLAVIAGALEAEMFETAVTGPDGREVRAAVGIVDCEGVPTGIVEMAQGSGLTLVAPENRNPLTATSRGLGEMMLAARERGARRFIVGIGGSATNDGGAGMLSALGMRLLDASGRVLPDGGASLADLAEIDISHARRDILACECTVICDVDNPLCGPQGASAVFGPQKGATPAMVAELDAALRHYGDVVCRCVGHDVSCQPGAGAAGGVGAALMAFFNARFVQGIDAVLRLTGVERELHDAALVITGEGSIDAQTLHGKAPAGVLRLAGHHGVPVVAVAGRVADRDALLAAGFADVVCVNTHGESEAEAMNSAVARRNVEGAVRELLKLF